MIYYGLRRASTYLSTAVAVVHSEESRVRVLRYGGKFLGEIVQYHVPVLHRLSRNQIHIHTREQERERDLAAALKASRARDRYRDQRRYDGQAAGRG
jgi:hypothetical protein